MRENMGKFRGKRVDNGEWVYGYYVFSLRIKRRIGGQQVMPCDADTHYIFDKNIPVEVDPATVGEYTGLKDNYNKEIYEDDVVEWDYYKKRKSGRVAWGGCGFWVQMYLEVLRDLFINSHNLLVIGNVHDKEVK